MPPRGERASPKANGGGVGYGLNGPVSEPGHWRGQCIPPVLWATYALLMRGSVVSAGASGQGMPLIVYGPSIA